MKKKNPVTLRTMPRHEPNERSEPPSPQAIIERQRAEAAAAKNPLAFSMGEPLPGRSALDKKRAQEKLDAARRAHEGAGAGVGDTVIARDRRHHGRTDRISPGRFIPVSRNIFTNTFRG